MVDFWHRAVMGFPAGERWGGGRAVVSLAPEVGKWWDFGLAVVWRPRAVKCLWLRRSPHAGDR